MKEALAVMAGGALGSLARWGFGIWFSTIPWSARFPLSTLAVNITGSFAIGLLSEITLASGQRLGDSGLRGFLIIGLLGGFTTFSAFSHQTIFLLREGQAALAMWNIFLSVSLCLLAVWAGLALAHRFPAPAP